MIANAILEHLHEPHPEGEDRSGARRDHRSRAVVAVVDDDAGLRRAVARMLGAHDCRAISTSDGHAAVDMCVRERPALVLLDVSMPNQNGPQILKALRARMGAACPAVVWMTGTVSADKMQRFEGASAILSKPFDARDVREVLSSFGINRG